MASIGGYSMLGWKGRLVAAVRRMAPLPPRPGINGLAYVMDAYQAPTQTIETSNEMAAAAVTTAIANYRALMDGNDKTIVDPTGISWTGKIIAVTCVPSFMVNGNVKLVSTWSIQVQSGP